MKIGPVDPEIALLNLKKNEKKKEINASKIYSPVGMFAERAKLSTFFSDTILATIITVDHRKQHHNAELPSNFNKDVVYRQPLSAVDCEWVGAMV